MKIKSYKKIETDTGDIGLVEIEEDGRTFYKIGVANLGSDESDKRIIAEHGEEVSDLALSKIEPETVTIDLGFDIDDIQTGGFGGVYGMNIPIPDPNDP